MKFTSIKLIALLFGVTLLSGCIEQKIKENLHEPGEYKGAHDPFLDVSGSQEFAAKLQQRFNQVQTDR